MEEEAECLVGIYKSILPEQQCYYVDCEKTFIENLDIYIDMAKKEILRINMMDRIEQLSER